MITYKHYKIWSFTLLPYVSGLMWYP